MPFFSYLDSQIGYIFLSKSGVSKGSETQALINCFQFFLYEIIYITYHRFGNSKQEVVNLGFLEGTGSFLKGSQFLR